MRLLSKQTLDKKQCQRKQPVGRCNYIFKKMPNLWQARLLFARPQRASFKLSNFRYLRSTVKLANIALGGCVDIWHMYNPASVRFTGFILSLQLLGYWYLTAIRLSPAYGAGPTVSSCAESVVRRSHITCTDTPAISNKIDTLMMFADTTILVYVVT